MRRLDPAQIEETIQKSALLGPLSDEALEALSRSVRHVEIEAGDILFARNSIAHSVYWLVEGRIRIFSVDRRGNELLLGMVEPGEFLGEQALFENPRRLVTAAAGRASYLLSLDRRNLLPILEKDAECAMRLAHIISAHLRNALSNIENLALHDAKTRVWVKVLSMTRRYEVVTTESGMLRIEHGYSQQDLADSLGLTRVMVNRQLNALRDLGFVEYGRGFIEIRDRDALEDHVWSDLAPQ